VTRTLDLTPFHTRDFDETLMTKLLNSHGFGTAVAVRQVAAFTLRDLLEERRARRGLLGRSALALARFYIAHPVYLLHRIWWYLVQGRVTIETAVFMSTSRRAGGQGLPSCVR